MTHEERDLLERRAQEIARPLDRNDTRTVAFSVCMVVMGGRRFGFPLERLASVVEVPRVTKVPGQAPWVRGAAVLRGELTTVLDANAFLGVERAGTGQFAVLVTGAQGSLALLVDSVEGHEEVFESDVVHRPKDHRAEFIAAMTRTGATIVNLDAIFARRARERNGSQ